MKVIHKVGYKNNQADQKHDFDLHICYTYLLKLTVFVLLIVVSLSLSLLSFKSLSVFFVCFFSLRACNLENMNAFLKN